jgi:hypothetical protein
MDCEKYYESSQQEKRKYVKKFHENVIINDAIQDAVRAFGYCSIVYLQRKTQKSYIECKNILKCVRKAPIRNEK